MLRQIIPHDMPLPRVILIDTNILEQYGYNFASQPIEKFVALTQVKSLTIVLPDAIEREVRRHITEKSAAAQAALKKARHEAPFIQKWAHWPSLEKAKTAKDDIAAAYLADWSQFLKNFEIERLGYTAIDMSQLMDWYDQHHAPFGIGQKEKEFPDAFALASTLAYAKEKSTQVAIVSDDKDFAKFCATHTELLYFPDLPAVTEAFLAEMKTQVAAIKAAVVAHPNQVTHLIRDFFPELAFYPNEDPEGEVSHVDVKSVDLTDARVIAIEDHQCTIAFDADVEFSAFVSYDDPDSMIIDTAEDIHMALHTRAGRVTETTTISATITLAFDPEWKSIVFASDLEIETDSVTVETRPPISYEEWEDPAETFEGFPDPPPLPDPPAPPSKASPKPPQ
jgi:hypothetical protein